MSRFASAPGGSLPNTPAAPTATPSRRCPANEIVDYMVDNGQWIVGTPDDAIAAIDRLQESSGGFGGLLVRGRGLDHPGEAAPQLRTLCPLRDAPVSRAAWPASSIPTAVSSAMRESLQGNRRAGLQRATDTYLARSQ